MTKKKGIYEENTRALPDKPYVTLTEAVTWIVDGDSRDDNYVAEMAVRHATQLRQQWGNFDGPAWLVPHLELLIQGREWQFPKNGGEFERDVTLRGFDRVKRWLARKQWTAREALDKVDFRLEEDRNYSLAYERCRELLWNACAAEEITLLGLERNRKTGEVTGEHKPIPFTFFLRPVFHWMGRGYHARGELSPAHVDDENKLETILNDQDSRPSYFEVLIRREDTLTLDKRFHQKEGSVNEGHRGRPPAYDWPRFHLETIRILEEEGEPGLDPEWASLADLERRMRDWCEDAWGRVPAESTIRKRVGAAVAEFRRRRKAEN